MYAQNSRFNSYSLLHDGRTVGYEILMLRWRAQYRVAQNLGAGRSEALSSIATQRCRKRSLCPHHILHPTSVYPYSMGGGPRERVHCARCVCRCMSL